MDQIKVFRRSLFGGYKKADVKQYIEELDKALNDKDTFYQLKLTQLELDYKESSKKLSSLNKSLQSEEQLRREAENRAQTLSQEKELLETRFREEQEQISQLTAQLDQSIEENAKLAAKMKNYQLKSEKYEQLNDTIGDIVLNAHSYANQVIEDAKKEAAELAMDSIENMSALSTRVNGMNQEIGEMGEKVGDYVQQMNVLLTQLTAEIETAASKIRPSHSQSSETVPEQAAEPPVILSEPNESESPRKVKPKLKNDDMGSAQFSPLSKNLSQGPFILS